MYQAPQNGGQNVFFHGFSGGVNYNPALSVTPSVIPPKFVNVVYNIAYNNPASCVIPPSFANIVHNNSGTSDTPFHPILPKVAKIAEPEKRSEQKKSTKPRARPLPLGRTCSRIVEVEFVEGGRGMNCEGYNFGSKVGKDQEKTRLVKK